jgi:NAD(P)H-dependent flavin oxidoreductase YrpB (nitropropane dioxygenase family)
MPSRPDRHATRIQAPTGGAVNPILVAAVSNAGGLGMLVLWRADIETIRRQIRETRELTSRPFGANLNLDLPQEERLAVYLEERSDYLVLLA